MKSERGKIQSEFFKIFGTALIYPAPFLFALFISASLLLCFLRIDWSAFRISFFLKMIKPLSVVLLLSLFFTVSFLVYELRKISPQLDTFIEKRDKDSFIGFVEKVSTSLSNIAFFIFWLWIFASLIFVALTYFLKVFPIYDSFAMGVVMSISAYVTSNIIYYHLQNRISRFIEELGRILGLTYYNTLSFFGAFKVPIKHKFYVTFFSVFAVSVIVIIFFYSEISFRTMRMSIVDFGKNELGRLVKMYQEDETKIFTADTMGNVFQASEGTEGPIEGEMFEAMKDKLSDGYIFDNRSLGVFVFTRTGENKILGLFYPERILTKDIYQKLPYMIGAIILLSLLFVSVAIPFVSYSESRINKMYNILSGKQEFAIADDEYSRIMYLLHKSISDKRELVDTVISITEKNIKSLNLYSSEIQNMFDKMQNISDSIKLSGTYVDDLIRLVKNISRGSEFVLPYFSSASEIENIIANTNKILLSLERVSEMISVAENSSSNLKITTTEIPYDSLVEDKLNSLYNSISVALELVKKIKVGMSLTRSSTLKAHNYIESMKRIFSDIDTGVSTARDVLLRMSEVSRKATLLSLNASIIAYQSSGYGGEFQVVAENISKLGIDIDKIGTDVHGALIKVYPLISEVKDIFEKFPPMSESDGKLQDFITNIDKLEEELEHLLSPILSIKDMTVDMKNVVSTYIESGRLINDFIRDTPKSFKDIKETVEKTENELVILYKKIKDIKDEYDTFTTEIIKGFENKRRDFESAFSYISQIGNILEHLSVKLKELSSETQLFCDTFSKLRKTVEGIAAELTKLLNFAKIGLEEKEKELKEEKILV